METCGGDLSVSDEPIPILAYHSVDTECSDAYRRWMVTPDVLDRHFSLLSELGYATVTVSELAEAFAQGGAVGPRTVAITFDDGLRDFLTGALPILRRYGFRATLYVVAGLVGKTGHWLGNLGEGQRPMLSWEELGEVLEHGIECGAHSNTHPPLDILSTRLAWGEISGSKQTLEDRLGRPVRTFAYPYGLVSQATRRLVREAGFTSACRVRHAMTSAREDPFGLSRIRVTGDVFRAELESFLQGKGFPVAPAPDRIRDRGKRIVRRLGRMGRELSSKGQ